MPLNDPSVHNPFGVEYTTVNHIVESETPLDPDITKSRVFKIINENVRNPMSGGPVGYKLVPHYSQMVLAHPSSYHFKRSEFGEHAVWVTRYSDEERYSAGEHTMQSLGGEGIGSWIRSRPAPVSVRNEDVVIWHAFGTTHNPRVEDWPVMPAEKMTVSLKSVNFFWRNPALDVPVSSQEDNKSVLVQDQDQNQGAAVQADACCKLYEPDRCDEVISNHRDQSGNLDLRGQCQTICGATMERLIGLTFAPGFRRLLCISALI